MAQEDEDGGWCRGGGESKANGLNENDEQLLKFLPRPGKKISRLIFCTPRDDGKFSGERDMNHSSSLHHCDEFFIDLFRFLLNAL